jgi:predicted AlkP superfamily pyrophosphatase or phosphodiesterase
VPAHKPAEPNQVREIMAQHCPRRPVLAALAFLAACGPVPPPDEPAPSTEADARAYVVMVSLDGMHPAFLARNPTPNLDRIAERGVMATSLIPTYPTRTFPNHYTMATGLRPARHGLVDNAFYDPALDATYRLGDRSTVEDGRWYGGEPIWVTAERQGVRSASFYWVGTEAPVQGMQPSAFKYYDAAFPYEARIDSVLHWLSLPAPERPGLVLLYFDEPDVTAHNRGPAAAGVDSVVRELDRLMGTLTDGLAALPIGDRINLILVSDHGMAESSPDNVIVLEDFVDLEGVRVVHNTTQAFLYFDGNEDRLWEVYEGLRERLHGATPHLRDETPEHWAYRLNRRIGDIVVEADPGWIIRWPGGRWTSPGMHGWDPRMPEMHGVFLAAGPGLRRGVVVPAFENIHIYSLVARLLDIEPAADVDGNIEAVADLLAAPGEP